MVLGSNNKGCKMYYITEKTILKWKVRKNNCIKGNLMNGSGTVIQKHTSNKVVNFADKITNG